MSFIGFDGGGGLRWPGRNLDAFRMKAAREVSAMVLGLDFFRGSVINELDRERKAHSR